MKKIFYILFYFVFTTINSFSQKEGCTDSLATNYDLLATFNDGTCSYNSSNISPELTFSLSETLKETSGLIYWNNLIWTHNDDTDVNIYSLNPINGNIIQSNSLKGTVNNDWEEISQDSNFVYVGNFGNNVNGNRKDLKILRINKNSILINNPIIDTINFSYSNQAYFNPTGNNNSDFDCEAFIVTSDSIYLFTKQWISNKTSIFSLPKTPGNYTAILKETFNIEGLVTGAILLESQKIVAICGYSNLLKPFIYLFYDYNGVDFFSGNKRKIIVSLPFHQFEGITTSDGLKYYLTNESFSQPPFINSIHKLYTFDLTSYLSHYLLNLKSK